MVFSQTNILNIFPASVFLAHVKRILESVCIRKTRKCIPQLALWISRPSIEFSQLNRQGLPQTLDCSSINKDRPGKFRTKGTNQIFKLIISMLLMMNRAIMKFISQCINSSKTYDRSQFNIIHLKSKMNSEETFDTT